MVEMQRVLFLTDFSSESVQALEYVRELAEKFGSRLFILHVIVDATSELYGMVSGDYHALDRNAQEKTREWLTQLHREQLHDSPNCETLMERGEIFEHVLKVVHDKHIDLIVLSAHYYPGFHLHLISNLPEKLVRKAPCHVLVIHTGTA
jgi:nucleotide-binding universal stress UspA family protein